METVIHVKDIVGLPNNEIGIVRHVKNTILGYNYEVEIIRGRIGTKSDFSQKQICKLPTYLVRPDDFHIFEIDKTNGCYRSFLNKEIKNRPHAYAHFTYENLTKNYGFFPITSKQISEYREKNHEHHDFISWQHHSDGHGGIKGGTYQEYLTVKILLKYFFMS